MARKDNCRSWSAGRTPIFKTLTQGLAAIPPTPADIREAVRGQLERDGTAVLHAELMQKDQAAAARLMPNDRSRITRALEVLTATGRWITDWHRDGLPPVLDPAAAVKVFLARDRAELYARIDARFDTMLKEGALDEVHALASRHLDPLLPAMKAAWRAMADPLSQRRDRSCRGH